MLNAITGFVCGAFTNRVSWMWIIAIAWMYVAVMMAMAEATSSQGTVLGAVITLVFYGLVPVSLVMYLLRASGRRRQGRVRVFYGTSLPP